MVRRRVEDATVPIDEHEAEAHPGDRQAGDAVRRDAASPDDLAHDLYDQPPAAVGVGAESEEALLRLGDGRPAAGYRLGGFLPRIDQ